MTIALLYYFISTLVIVTNIYGMEKEHGAYKSIMSGMYENKKIYDADCALLDTLKKCKKDIGQKLDYRIINTELPVAPIGCSRSALEDLSLLSNLAEIKYFIDGNPVLISCAGLSSLYTADIYPRFTIDTPLLVCWHHSFIKSKIYAKTSKIELLPGFNRVKSLIGQILDEFKNISGHQIDKFLSILKSLPAPLHDIIYTKIVEEHLRLAANETDAYAQLAKQCTVHDWSLDNNISAVSIVKLSHALVLARSFPMQNFSTISYCDLTNHIQKSTFVCSMDYGVVSALCAQGTTKIIWGTQKGFVGYYELGAQAHMNSPAYEQEGAVIHIEGDFKNDRAFVLYESGRVYIYHFGQTKLTKFPHEDVFVTACALSPSGNHLVCGTNNGWTIVYNSVIADTHWIPRCITCKDGQGVARQVKNLTFITEDIIKVRGVDCCSEWNHKDNVVNVCPVDVSEEYVDSASYEYNNDYISSGSTTYEIQRNMKAILIKYPLTFNDIVCIRALYNATTLEDLQAIIYSHNFICLRPHLQKTIMDNLKIKKYDIEYLHKNS
jgi:hypothetical protein